MSAMTSPPKSASPRTGTRAKASKSQAPKAAEPKLQAPKPKKTHAQVHGEKARSPNPLRGPNRDPSVLTPREVCYVEEYLKCLNQTQAYIKAGGSAKSATSAVQEMHNRPRVLNAIALGLAARKDRYEVTAARVLRELAGIAFGDPRSLYTKHTYDNGDVATRLKAVNDLDDDEAKMLAGVKPTANGTEYKLHDRTRALELLGRHLALFNDTLNLNARLMSFSPEQLAKLSDAELDAVLAAAEKVAQR